MSTDTKTYTLEQAQQLINRQFPAGTEEQRRQAAQKLYDYVKRTDEPPERTLIKLF